VAPVHCYNDISLVLSGIQGDCKVTVKRMDYSKDRYKMEAGVPSFSCV
jgi:20S proteasome alpha/beta subunit